MNKELLDLCTDYLLSSFGQTTLTGLSKLMDGAVSHDQVSRMFTSPRMTSKDWCQQPHAARCAAGKPLSHLLLRFHHYTSYECLYEITGAAFQITGAVIQISGAVNQITGANN